MQIKAATVESLDIASHNLLNIHCQLILVDGAALRLNLAHINVAVVIQKSLLLLYASLVSLDTYVQESQKKRYGVFRMPSSLVMGCLAYISLLSIFPRDCSWRLHAALFAVYDLHASAQHVTLLVPPLANDHFS